MYCTEIAGFFHIARAEENLWFIKFVRSIHLLQWTLFGSRCKLKIL